MIRLKNLLLEEESKSVKPADDKTADTEKSAALKQQIDTNELGGRVLFVGDDETKTKKSYAKQVTSAMKLNSNILAFNGITNAQIAKIIRRVISPEYSIVTIMASSHDGGPGKTNNAIRNLTSAINAAKRYGAKVIVISNPTKRYLKKTDKMYKDHEYPSNDEIGNWVNNQDLSDATIDANSFRKSNFEIDNYHLNDSGQEDIALQWISIVEPLQSILKKKLETGPKVSDTKDTTVATTTAVTLPVALAANIDMDIDVSKGKRVTPSRIYDFLIDKGLSPAGAAGILGNMYIESGFKTGALGDSGSSLGLVQWHASRKKRLIQRAKDQGVDPLSIDFQLEHLWWDLTTNFSSLTNTLKTIKDPEEAAYMFADIFENPTVIQSSRKIAARQYYNMFS